MGMHCSSTVSLEDEHTAKLLLLEALPSNDS
jgi:hypothetical protein